MPNPTTLADLSAALSTHAGDEVMYMPDDISFAADLKAGMEVKITFHNITEGFGYTVDLRDVTDDELKKHIEQSDYFEESE
jgi:hypothetical protein